MAAKGAVSSGVQRLPARLALLCALVGLGGFSLVRWLAYLPAVMAFAMFTLVIWFAACDSFVRIRPVPLRVAAAVLAGAGSTVLFWHQIPGWFSLPALWSALAAVSTRGAAWIATACLAAAYGILFLV